MRRSAVLVLAALLQAGCLVHIEHTADPTAAFQDARTEALRFQGQPGPAHRLNVLVYDPGDREMVRVSVPMWLARKAASRVDWDDATGAEGNAARHLRRLRLEDIEKAGLGILAEVSAEDGEQVLVWLR
jgi:hypothetical protein